jgi:hypothetical protein
MSNNFRKYPLKQEQFKDFQALLYKLKDFQGLEFLFPNSRIQVLYEPYLIIIYRSVILCRYTEHRRI